MGGWKRAERRQSDVKADRRPVTPFHVSIITSICRESLLFSSTLGQIPLNATIFANFIINGDCINRRIIFRL